MLFNVQGLRALAAMLVVVYHVQQSAAKAGGIAPFFPIGSFGVDLFFVISGFIMFHTTRGFRRSSGEFLVNRLIRIVPLYWLATAALLALFAVGFRPNGLQAVAPADILSSILMIPRELAGGRDPLILLLGWTLIYELTFYLLFALTFPFRSHRISFALLAAVFTGLALLRGPALELGFTAAYFTSSIMFEFLFGCGLALLYDRAGTPRSWAMVPAALLIAGGFVMLWGVDPNKLPIDLSLATRPVRAGVPAAMIVAGALLAERAGGRLRWPPLLLLGDASYSLYLSHPLVLQPAVAVARRVVHLDGPAMSAAVVLVALAAACMVAIGVHLWIERPLTQWLRVRLTRPLRSDEPLGEPVVLSAPRA